MEFILLFETIRNSDLDVKTKDIKTTNVIYDLTVQRFTDMILNTFSFQYFWTLFIIDF